MLKMSRCIGAFALLLALNPVPASAEIVTRFNWIPGTSGMGDVWTFSCPAGGTFDVIVQNRNDGYMSTGGALDLMFSVVDAGGMGVGGGDDEIPCLSSPSCAACPQALNLSCGSGGTFGIKVSHFGRCGGAGTGAGYGLAVEVRDANSNSLPAKKVKLGGGPKIKVPSWQSPSSLPVINDGQLN